MMTVGHAAAASDTIRINVDSVPISLDPPLLTDSIASWVLHHVADRLVEEHKPGQLQGNLAKSWKITSDKTTYCFEIVEGRKFSDNTPVTAQLVANSIQLAMKKKSSSRVGFYLENIESVSVQNNGSVCIKLHRPSVNFLQILADASFSISKIGKDQNEILYSGQYLVGKRGSKFIEIVRKGDNQVFRLETLSFTDALKRFRSGQLEIIKNSGTGGLNEVLNLKVKRAKMPDERTFFMAFNLKSGVFKSSELRHRLLNKINWNGLRSSLEKDRLTLSTSLLSPTLFHAGGKAFSIQ